MERPSDIHTKESDRFYDYLWFEYEPKVQPSGKLRPVEVLYQTFDATNCPDEYYSLTAKLQAKLGINRTVWGVKLFDGKISWEYYWYNYHQGGENVSIKQVLKLLQRDETTLPRALLENVPSMFSVDIGPDFFQHRKIDELHVYRPGHSQNSGISYLLNRSGFSLENCYTFLKPMEDFELIRHSIKCSVYLDFRNIQIQSVLPLEFINCKSICLASKPDRDSIYFSGLTIDQLILFLDKYDYPKSLTAAVCLNRAQLDYIQFDAGFDYRMNGAELEILKSGFYGTF